MVNFFFYLLVSVIIGCSKVDKPPLTPEEPQTSCPYYDENPPDLLRSSYELFDITSLQPNGEVNMEMLRHIGDTWEYGFGGVYIDYNNDGVKDIVGYRNDYNNHVIIQRIYRR